MSRVRSLFLLATLTGLLLWGCQAVGGRSSGEEARGGHPLAGLPGIIVAPLAATLIQMAISRGRELPADETAGRSREQCYGY